MEYEPLGRSGLKISRVCLGAMNFGAPAGTPGCDPAEAGRIIGAYLDAGGNIIDTADGYSSGQSEEIVGRAIKGRRDEVVLATKAFLPQAVITGPRTLSQVHDNLAGFSLTLPPDALARLTDISGPASSEPVTSLGAHH
jgi:aryl-alcohol dehydrogenase-like predicted oxidoreductase